MVNHNRDWEDLSRRIQSAVDQAVNSRDYQWLNQTIRQTVDRVVDIGGEAVRKAREDAAYSGNAGQQYTAGMPQKKRPLYGGTVGKSIAAVFKTAIGGALTLFALLYFFGFSISNMPFVENISTIVFALGILAVGVWLTYSGVTTLGMVKRYKAYRDVLGQQTHCTLESLACRVGKNVKFVRADVRKMIHKGLFREGHMDKDQTSLITSNETFRHYEQSRRAFEERQQQESAARPETGSAAITPQVQEVLDRGNAFISQIRKCNDDIPGEEISEKIFHMETIIRRIFERAEEHPEIVPDLKKLMDYYLPMTVKLLDAYADMDAQPVQGETIQASKREIESSLDTLNLAFEKLLDSIFKDTAMDVSSDISVLNTMLAQEGLTEDEFPKMKKQ